MAGHDQRPLLRLRIGAFERRDHVGERRRFWDARRGLLNEFVEFDFEPCVGFGSAAVQRVADPAPRGADAALWIAGYR